MSEFVVKYCRQTQYIYPYLAALKGDERVPLCIPCVNWQRRCTLGQKKRCAGKKPLLLMDHFILFMLEPGRVTIPDQRCLHLLVKALMQADNPPPALALMPVQVQAMVAMLPAFWGKTKPSLAYSNSSASPDVVAAKSGHAGTGQTQPQPPDLLHLLVRVWWEYHGRTVFFAHNITPKLVRKMFKDCGDSGVLT